MLAKREHPDLIILDIMLPGMDGHIVARQLRSNSETSFIPIIIFTWKSRADDKVEGLEAGANTYIAKPAQPRELIAQAQSLLKRRVQRSQALRPLCEKEGNVIGMIAAKGGIGISSLATNLAIELHNQS